MTAAACHGSRRAASALAVLAAAAAMAGLAGCSSNVRGSWSCAIDRGGSCGSIKDIDHDVRPKGRALPVALDGAPDRVMGGAVPAALERQGGRWSAGLLAGAPVHETDQILKVVVAPWIDRAGDYHGLAEIFAVVRKGGWFIAQPRSTRRVDLTAATLADMPPPVLTPVAEVRTPPAPSQTKPPLPPGVTMTKVAAPGAAGSTLTVVASTPVPNPPPACDRPLKAHHHASPAAPLAACHTPGS